MTYELTPPPLVGIWVSLPGGCKRCEGVGDEEERRIQRRGAETQRRKKTKREDALRRQERQVAVLIRAWRRLP